MSIPLPVTMLSGVLSLVVLERRTLEEPIHSPAKFVSPRSGMHAQPMPRFSNFPIVFNTAKTTQKQFRINTSRGNNTSPNQSFVSCEGYSLYWDIYDDFSPVDVPNGFAAFPQQGHTGNPITVAQFIAMY